jgi:hypothetical protein
VNILASNPMTKTIAPISSTTGAPPAIPYRTSASIPTGSLATALAITALVLAVLVGCVAYARRRGWLVGAIAGKHAAPDAGIEVRATRRVSMATTAHVVAYRGLEYLVVESGRGCITTVSPLGTSDAGEGDAP